METVRVRFPPDEPLLLVRHRRKSGEEVIVPRSFSVIWTEGEDLVHIDVGVNDKVADAWRCRLESPTGTRALLDAVPMKKRVEMAIDLVAEMFRNAEIAEKPNKLEEVVEVYHRTGGGYGAVTAVAKQLGVSRNTASRRDNAARRAGLLPSLRTEFAILWPDPGRDLRSRALRSDIGQERSKRRDGQR